MDRRVWNWITVLAVLASPVAAQELPRGEVGRPEVRGLDFRPDGAWRKRADAVRSWRRQQLQSGNVGALNRARSSAALRSSGTQATDPALVAGSVFVPVIPVAYSNVAVAYPVNDFQDVLFSANPGSINRAYSLKTYYEELSNGLITMTGRVFEPARMDSTDLYYQDGCNGIGVVNTCPNGGRRFGGMLLAALDSISIRPGGDTAWSRFDNDGPDGVPNSGDDDGVVDFVTFLHPTVDGSCSTPGVWAHRWVISGWNNGSPYLTKTPRRDGAGQPIPNQFIRVNDYTIQSQLGGNSGCDGTTIMPIGTVAHETGHAFGLPDLYDTDASSRTEGIGEWGLMGSGNFARSYSPASYDAWSLVELGWVSVRELSQSQLVETGARQVADTVLLARTASTNNYFLLENRQAVQSDSAQMNPAFGARRKSPGLLIWQIDLARIASGRSSNRINTGPVQGVALMQADGLNQLRISGTGRNRGDAGDSYPGSSGNTRFGLSTTPSARTNFGEFAGFAIDRIEQLAAGVMRFRFTRREPSVFRSSRTGAVIAVNGTSTARYEEVVPQGDQVTIAADSAQSSADGRSAFRFLSWSNGGPRAQTVTSGTRPDTLSAAFSAQHRVRATVQGGGQVQASVAGDVTNAGVLVEEGASVTLTAVAVPGTVLAGWQGDTVATGTTLRLTMGRPYDVTAVFLVEQVIPVQAATDELLGTPKLTDEQRSYLDQLGNRNFGYDVGDYLALLNRTGATPSPALLAKLAELKRGRN
jgi:M6 family metalloprotease-like protein